MVLRVSRGLLSPFCFFRFSQDLHLRRGIAGRASFILQGVNSLNFMFNYKFEYYGSESKRVY